MRLEVLKNDPAVPSTGPTGMTWEPSDDKWLKVCPFDSKDSVSQHPSQYWSAIFKTQDEPLEVLNHVRMRMKFGVLKVTNLPRSLRKGRIRCGNANRLTADLSIMPLKESPNVVKSKDQRWSESKKLMWYCDGWDDTFRETQGLRVSADNVKKLKEVENRPFQFLNSYLKLGGSTYDVLSPRRAAYLWLFFTVAEIPSGFWTTSGFEGPIPNKYRLKVGIASADQMQIKEYYYEMYIRTWSNFTIDPINEN